MARTMMIASNMTKTLWFEAINIVAYILKDAC